MRPAATQKSKRHPSPLQGRNNESPARKCRVSSGSRAPHSPLSKPIIESSMTIHFANRPANVCVESDVSSASTERSRSCRQDSLSVVILNERRFCVSEGPRRAARCLAFFARQYSRVWHASLSSSGKARPCECLCRAGVPLSF